MEEVAGAPPQEKQLFHGTASKNLALINARSFDRGYSRSFRKGVYFATHASYSAASSYSAPDSSRMQFMYLARVLVGSSKRIDGSISPNPPFESYCDRLSDPTMFVICNDMNCYPEYLITFTSMQQDTALKMFNILSKVKAFAFVDRFQVALNLIDSGMKIAQNSRSVEYIHDLESASETVSRMICRAKDPREWTLQEMTDYVRCATGDFEISIRVQGSHVADGKLAKSGMIELQTWLEQGADDMKPSLQQIVQLDLARRIREVENLFSESLKHIALPGAPAHWTQPESQARLKLRDFCLVELECSCPEYIQTAAKFKESCDGQILSVQRLQNFGVWTLYKTMRRIVEGASGAEPNEMQLFHGTSSENTRAINTRSFDRIVHSSGESRHGKGVHFARLASRCNKHSKPDSSGRRYMYLARVLVGMPTPGRSGIVSPPPPRGDTEGVRVDSETRFDSTCDGADIHDSSVFVVYRDAQAYPDYLITYREAKAPNGTAAGTASAAAAADMPLTAAGSKCHQQ